MADATEAMRLNPDSENNSYYQDEIMMCGQELSRRLKPKNKQRPELHNTLTEIAVILQNAGRDPRDMIGELRKMTSEDWQAKYNELVKAICCGQRHLEITAEILTAIAL
jgi:hypothetical protein